MLNIGWVSRNMTPQKSAMIQGQKHQRIGAEGGRQLVEETLKSIGQLFTLEDDL